MCVFCENIKGGLETAKNTLYGHSRQRLNAGVKIAITSHKIVTISTIQAPLLFIHYFCCQ